VHND